MAVTLIYFAGLLLMLLGERLLGDSQAARVVLSGGGALAVLAATIWRGLTVGRATGERRGVEKWLLGAQVLGVLGLLLYAASTTECIDKFGSQFSDAQTRERYRDILTVLWPIFVGAAVLAMAFCERAYWPMRQAHMLEARRVRASLLVGLEIAFAAAFLSVVGFIARERDVKVDVSYFRTSKPSASTSEIIKSFGEPMKFVLFFPDVNEVRDEVYGYARELAASTGGRVTVESYDRMVTPKLAEDYKVTKDGTIVLVRGDKKETLPIGTEIDSVRAKLRTLDRDLQKALMKMAREKRTIYLTSGHGELGDPQPPDRARERPQVTTFKKLAETMNLTVKNLGVTQGLSNEVPSDAAAVVSLGPTAPFLPEEQAALRRYLEGGGRLMMALDSEWPIDLGEIAQALGITYQPARLASEKLLVRRRYNDSDFGIIATNRFSSHASVTSLSRHSRELATIMLSPGSFEKVASDDKSRKVDFVIKSSADTYADANANFHLDAPAEKKAVYNLAAAVSQKLPKSAASAAAAKKPADEKDDPKKKKPGASDAEPEMRVYLLGDADALGDPALQLVGNLYMVADAIKWVVGDEQFAGEVSETEEDVKIEHTRGQDVMWFYGTIFAMPAIVLVGGLLYTSRLRRRAPQGQGKTKANS